MVKWVVTAIILFVGITGFFLSHESKAISKIDDINLEELTAATSLEYIQNEKMTDSEKIIYSNDTSLEEKSSAFSLLYKDSSFKNNYDLVSLNLESVQELLEEKHKLILESEQLSSEELQIQKEKTELLTKRMQRMLEADSVQDRKGYSFHLEGVNLNSYVIVRRVVTSGIYLLLEADEILSKQSI